MSDAGSNQCDLDFLSRTIRFKSTSFRAEEQFAAWQELANPMLNLLRPKDAKGVGYSADTTSYHLGSIVASSERFDTMRYEISHDLIRRMNFDHWIIGVNRAGYGISEVNGAVSRTPRGAVAVRSLARPVRGEVRGDGLFLIYLPRGLFPEKANAIDAASLAGVVTGPLGTLLSDFLFSLDRQLPFIKEHQLPELCDAVRTMVGCCLAPTRDGIVEARETISATLLERARRYIDCNLGSPTLSPDELSRVLGISRSSLYRLFEGIGGVSAEIRRRRLRASHRLLSQVEPRQPIYRIAETFGFASPDEFAKTFRRQFGYTPSDARGRTTPSVRAGTTFKEWLLGLSP